MNDEHRLGYEVIDRSDVQDSSFLDKSHFLGCIEFKISYYYDEKVLRGYDEDKITDGAAGISPGAPISGGNLCHQH
ncbi:MAG: hypothetical protein WA137_03375 [Methanothrix sp.]